MREQVREPDGESECHHVAHRNGELADADGRTEHPGGARHDWTEQVELPEHDRGPQESNAHAQQLVDLA